MNDDEVVAKQKELLAAGDFQAMIDLGKQYEIAKANKRLQDAEIAFMASLPQKKRDRLQAIGRVCTGEKS